MKNSIIKFKHSIIALIMIVLNGVGAKASTPWTVNPGDYRYDMSLYLDVTFAASPMDYSKYDIAVFCGDQCRGVAERLSLGNGKECLYLRARSNQASGETMTFKYYNKETEEIQTIDGASFTFESNGRLGYPSEAYIVKIAHYYDVTLMAGEGGSINQQGGRIAEGTELTITATPSEGHHFEQWSDGNTDNPRTIIVNADVILGAEFGVNTYKLTYNVDEVVYKEYTVEYGTAITAETYPEKEGNTFSGWDNVPATMPAHDVIISGTFTINSYNAIFKIGDEVFKTVSVVYGEPVTAPAAPAKEGYTFDGWQNVPDVMPAHDVEITGSYTVNQYKLVYTVDGASYKEYTVDYGTAITAEAYPEKEGHTFSGWDNVPTTMPAHDVTVSGTFIINSYNAIFKIGNDVFETVSVVYDEPVTAPEAPAKEGYTFNGWQNVLDAMPAHDVEITGSYTVNSYKLVYKVDGSDYKEYTVDYGTAIIAEAIPEKEGYTFSGWDNVPATMPAHDMTVSGTFSINSYNAIFKIGDKVFETVSVVYGEPVTAPEAPAKEGYTFDGWQDIPEAMPAHDVEILGSYTINSYKLVYTVDGTFYKEYTVDYGTAITAEAIPEKEGHTFSGWDNLPATMPAHDVTVNGTFSINSYNAIFKIGDEVFQTVSVVYGEPVTAPEAPAKEGYTFDGWQDIPEAMPAHDIEILGRYTVNLYKLTYIIDGETYKEAYVEFGAIIEAETPEKEGHTFSGWDAEPETMPAHDLTVYGSFSKNSYNLNLYLNDVLCLTELVEYGSELNITAPEVPEGKKFDGWIEEIPETMPAHDVDIHGSYSDIISSIADIHIEDNQRVIICTISGVVIYKNVLWQDVQSKLENGLYIINGAKYLIQH